MSCGTSSFSCSGPDTCSNGDWAPEKEGNDNNNQLYNIGNDSDNFGIWNPKLFMHQVLHYLSMLLLPLTLFQKRNTYFDKFLAKMDYDLPHPLKSEGLTFEMDPV